MLKIWWRLTAVQSSLISSVVVFTYSMWSYFICSVCAHLHRFHLMPPFFIVYASTRCTLVILLYWEGIVRCGAGVLGKSGWFIANIYGWNHLSIDDMHVHCMAMSVIQLSGCRSHTNTYTHRPKIAWCRWCLCSSLNSHSHSENGLWSTHSGAWKKVNRLN